MTQFFLKLALTLVSDLRFLLLDIVLPVILITKFYVNQSYYLHILTSHESTL